MGGARPSTARKNRNGRSDDAITIKKRSPADQRQEKPSLFRDVEFGQGQKRKDAAFPMVVEPEQEIDVLQRDNGQQIPDDEADGPGNMGGIGMILNALPERVDRRGPDIAKDHPKAANRKPADG